MYLEDLIKNAPDAGTKIELEWLLDDPDHEPTSEKYIICPHCGNYFAVDYEALFAHEVGEVDEYCYHCGNNYKVITDIKFSYTTWKGDDFEEK